MKNVIEIETNKGKARLHKGTPKGDCPITYKKLDVLGHNIGNAYNPNTLTLFENRQGVLKYEIYRDGCFFPFYGTFEWIDCYNQPTWASPQTVRKRLR